MVSCPYELTETIQVYVFAPKISLQRFTEFPFEIEIWDGSVMTNEESLVIRFWGVKINQYDVFVLTVGSAANIWMFVIGTNWRALNI